MADIGATLDLPHSDRLSLSEAAAYLGCSPLSLGRRDWRQRHAIPTIRVGRLVVFDRVDLADWLRERRTGGGAA